MKTRREFIKDACTTCLATTFLGLTFTQLTSCSSLPIYKTNLAQKKVDVPATVFVESNLVIVRDLQVPFDILLVKKSDEEYKAIYMKCSHQENPVTATKTGLFCSSHGSRFDLDGKVLNEPALEPLKKYKTEVKDNITSIDLNS
jgi:Rieske Fe-S protein